MVLSPLLARFDSSKPLFLKIDWSAIGIGYILMQPDDSTETRAAISKLLRKENALSTYLLTAQGLGLYCSILDLTQ